jgi:hypothetical protein
MNARLLPSCPAVRLATALVFALAVFACGQNLSSNSSFEIDANDPFANPGADGVPDGWWARSYMARETHAAHVRTGAASLRISAPPSPCLDCARRGLLWGRANASKSADPFNANDARGAKGTQTPIRTAVFSRRGAEARRSLGCAMRRDASAFPPRGSSRFSTVPIPISIHFSQRTQRAQRSLDDSPGGSICVHLGHLRLKIRNFHGMENVFSNRRNRTQRVAEACRSLRSSRAWREAMAVYAFCLKDEILQNTIPTLIRNHES